MKLELTEFWIRIIPESDVEKAYLRTFGFTSPGVKREVEAISYIDAKSALYGIEIRKPTIIGNIST